MCQQTIKNFELVTITLTANTAVYNFGNEFNLRNAKRVVGIRAYYASTAGMKDPNAVALCNSTAFKSGYLEIATGANDRPISKIPLMELALLPNTDNPAPMVQLDLPEINPSKCQVYFGNAAAITTGEVLLLGFIFESK